MTLRTLPLVLGSLTLVACATSAEPLALGSTQGLDFEAFKAHATPLPNGGYLIYGDDPVQDEADLRRRWAEAQQGALAVNYQNGARDMWSATQRKNLTYCVSNSFGANKAKLVTALQAASDLGWEKFADVNFSYVPGQDANCVATNTAVVFRVVPHEFTDTTLAAAFYPSFSQAQRELWVDSSSFTTKTPLANIMAHELGHILGLRHEHDRQERGAIAPAYANDCETGGGYYLALTTYDSASVMHYIQCAGTGKNLSFSERDRVGIATLYGAPVVNPLPFVQIAKPVDFGVSAPSFTASFTITDNDLATVQVFLDDKLITSLTASPWEVPFTNLAEGNYTLNVVATDKAGGKTTVESNFTVVPTPQAEQAEKEAEEELPSLGGGPSYGTVTDGPAKEIGDDSAYAKEEISGGCIAGGSGSMAWLVLLLLGWRRARREVRLAILRA